MQHIYLPADLLEAQVLRAMLASENIAAHIGGEHLLGAIGELPAAGLLVLSVSDEQAERARLLIAAYNAAQPLPVEEPPSCPGELLC
ncbi:MULTISPECIES: putative signal transducing protein [Pseudomonas]|jgi:hypothetical protein|uniref:DUF2007 domain-containing protein n=1 Tax=Serpens gallinarum TaxID=2763075 RepID=A0ABR8TR68_9PSED|nr:MULTISPECIES: DUF2007 domain-containing protein [Pseudomonas]MBD7978278.1 DUF2007 domain-containing protein [Serpens gallinarum]MBF0676310.1 DUF2007 domain-containing protein [Pseudomonas sp.]